MKNWIRTDLAVELREGMDNQEMIPGVFVHTKRFNGTDIQETRIRIESREGEHRIGKPRGTYITLESDELRCSDESYHEEMCKQLYLRLREMIGDARRILVAGLGNREVTPDALGPLVIDHLYVTRHLIRESLLHAPLEISALAPGVMAQTGMESQEILKGIVERMDMDCLLVIDALAAGNPHRLNKTIQLSDTGIEPGSGVGNHRRAITRGTMGVPVIALGVPTVISVPAIIEEAMDRMCRVFHGENRMLMGFTDQERYMLAAELVEPDLANMFVTPKNIDEAVGRISYTISEAINRLQHAYNNEGGERDEGE